MQLRPYQIDALASTMLALERNQHPVLSVATGGGKSLLIAALCQQLQGRVLIVTHVKELVQQNIAELLALDASQDVGIYSAGLAQRDVHQRIVFASVQSIYQKMDTLQATGLFKYVLVDEVHLVAPQDSSAKMYNAVFAACSTAHRIGLSATPYRLDAGAIYGPSPCWFDTLTCDIGIKQLTPTYLAPLRGILTAHDIPLDGVRLRQGEYVTSDLSQVACDETLVEGALDELCYLARNRKKWLIFCVDMSHAALVADRLNKRDITTGIVLGTTPSEKRAHTISAFKTGALRAVTNVQVLTVGSNIPAIDCIVLFRPTASKGLLIQMLGRGTRLHEGKRDAAVIDFSGNLERHSPLHELKDTWQSPERVKADAENQRQAEATRQRDLTHDRYASLADPMAEDAALITAPVEHVSYKVEPSRNEKYRGLNILKVLYKLGHPLKWVTGFVCHEYSGYPRQQAERWFARRHVRMPATAAEALREARQYPKPSSVVIKKEGKYWQVVIEQFEGEA